jgi:ABC-type transport system involved in cytochrome c biogenesis permease subunit
MTFTLFTGTFALFLLSFTVGVIGHFIKSPRRFRPGMVLFLLGWVALGLLLARRGAAAGHWPLSNQYESMLFLLWSVGMGAVIFVGRARGALEWLTPWVAGLSLLGMGIVSLLDPTVTPLMPALQSNWLLIHVVTTMVGYGAFMLSFLGGVALLTMGRRLEKVTTVAAVESLAERCCAVGFLFLTFGIITGAVWANSAWGSYWSWDPKETWALVTWLFYAGAIHLRRMKGWRGRRFAWLMVAGFAVVMFTYFGVNYLLTGLHSYA